MDAYFTHPFLNQFPDNLSKSALNVNAAYLDLYRSLKHGYLIASVGCEALIEVIEKLNITQPELAKMLTGLEEAGRIKAVEEIQQMPACFESITMPKTKRNIIGCAFAQTADTVYHDELEGADRHQAFMKAGNKPLFLNEQLKNGEIRFLFKEQSIYLTKGDAFQWLNVFPKNKSPLKEIRIVDPFFYVNISNIELSLLLKPLTQFEGTSVVVTIISDANAKSNLEPDDVLKKVREAFKNLNISNIDLKLYNQKGSASQIFHKRVLWSNLWLIQSDRGFDFLKKDGNGKAVVKSSNNILLTGRYTDPKSIWYDISHNWEMYINASNYIEIKT